MNSLLEKILLVLSMFLIVVIFSLAIRGMNGNPDSEMLQSKHWTWDGPLELSPERGRIALLYSFVEDHSLQFSLDVARLAIPDLAVNSSGKYVSLFSPGPSFLAIPGYLLGKQFGVSIVGAFATSAFFAILNLILIYAISIQLKSSRSAALLGALTFSFATPAFVYASELYQHHMTVFFLLISVWAMMRFQRSFFALAIVWFSCAISIVVDNPNIFLMFPVGIFSLFSLKERLMEGYEQKLVLKSLVFTVMAIAVVIPPILFLGWYNNMANGNPFQLPGTLQAVDDIGEHGEAIVDSKYDQIGTQSQDKPQKTATGFFKTRNLYNGFFIHFISPDRGILYFTPIILFGILGLFVLYRRSVWVAALFVAIIGTNTLLYSMWGDPWGGWAFGSRYLIPSYALLGIAIAIVLTYWEWRKWLIIAFLPLFAYSAWVNSLGAVTTSLNPPKIQVLALEEQSGHEEKYTFLRNWEFLQGKYESVGSKAFVYQNWAKSYMTAQEYHKVLFSLIIILVLGIWLVSAREIFFNKKF